LKIKAVCSSETLVSTHVLRRIFEPAEKDVTKGWLKLHRIITKFIASTFQQIWDDEMKEPRCTHGGDEK
jgi:lambda repressor-like predicted transcriptional regulator